MLGDKAFALGRNVTVRAEALMSEIDMTKTFQLMSAEDMSNAITVRNMWRASLV